MIVRYILIYELMELPKGNLTNYRLFFVPFKAVTVLLNSVLFLVRLNYAI